MARFGRQNMNDWQSTSLGRGALPRDLSGFEIEAFFTYSEPERRIIDDERRTPALKLALALQIGFLGMVPPVLWRHLGAQFDIEAPDLASLRTMYRRRRTLFEHQYLACAVVGFHSICEPRRRALGPILFPGTNRAPRIARNHRRSGTPFHAFAPSFLDRPSTPPSENSCPST